MAAHMLEALALASHGGQLIHERRRSMVLSEVAPALVTDRSHDASREIESCGGL
jgi:hypothetical protein